MTGLIDGLGFEEVNQSGLSTSLIQSVSGVHTRTIADNVIGLVDVSGLNMFAQGSVAAGKVETADGALTSINNTDGFGARIETGSCATTATGFGSAVFQANFTDARYFWSATASSGGTFLAVNAGSVVPMVSGVLGLNISGFTFKAAPSTPYSWVAIGL